MIVQDEKTGKFYAIAKEPAGMAEFQKAISSGKAREVSDADSFTSKAIERKVGGALPGLAEAAEGVSRIPYVGPFAQYLVPQTPTDVGMMAGTAMLGPAGIALRGASPWLSRAIAPAGKALAPSLSAGQRWAGRALRPLASAAGGGIGAAAGGDEDVLTGVAKGGAAGLAGEGGGKVVELASRWAGRPLGALSWSKPSLAETDLERVRGAVSRILPESARDLASVKTPGDLNNVMRGTPLSGNASRRLESEISGVEGMVPGPRGTTQTGSIRQSPMVDVPSMGGPVTLRDAMTAYQGQTARTYDPTTGAMRTGANTPMASAERVRLREEIMNALGPNVTPGGFAADRLDEALRHFGKSKEIGNVFGPKRESLSAKGGLAMDPLRDIVGLERLKSLQKVLPPAEFQDFMNAVFRMDKPGGWGTLARDVKPKMTKSSPDIGESMGASIPGAGWLRVYPHRLKPPNYIGDLPAQLRIGGYPTRGLTWGAQTGVNAMGREEQ